MKTVPYNDSFNSGRTLQIPISSRLSSKPLQDGLKVPIYSNHNDQPYISLNLKKAEEKTTSDKGLESWNTFQSQLKGAFKTKDDYKDEATGVVNDGRVSTFTE